MQTKRPSDIEHRERLLLTHVLLSAVLEFLAHNQVPRRAIRAFISSYSQRARHKAFTSYSRSMDAWGSMSKILEVWYTNPRFVDETGAPREIFARGRKLTLEHLIKAAGAKISTKAATQMLEKSPSIIKISDNSYKPISRVFLLPKVELLRAAYVVERFLSTVAANTTRHVSKAPALLERNCYVSDAGMDRAIPVMRSIKDRASVFMDSVDGELENCRVKGSSSAETGELGVLVFAWCRPNKKGARRARAPIRS